MVTRRREFLVGLFALIGLMALLVLTIQIRGTALFERNYHLRVRFPQVAGSLARGASILVYGVTVGEVLDIRIEPDTEFPDTPVAVDLRIRESMTLYENAEVEVKESAIIGETTVVIGPGSPDRAPLADGMTIVGASPSDVLADIQEMAPEILFEIAESVRIVRAFLDNLNENHQVSETIANLATIIAAVEETIVAEEGGIQGMVTTLNESLTLLRDILARTEETVATVGAFTQSNAPRWESIGAQLDSALGDIDHLTAQMRSGEGTVGRLLADEALHREVVNLLASLNGWLSELDAWIAGAEEPREERVIPYERQPAPLSEDGSTQ